jgi:hypothetical protein
MNAAARGTRLAFPLGVMRDIAHSRGFEGGLGADVTVNRTPDTTRDGRPVSGATAVNADVAPGKPDIAALAFRPLGSQGRACALSSQRPPGADAPPSCVGVRQKPGLREDDAPLRHREHARRTGTPRVATTWVRVFWQVCVSRRRHRRGLP